MGYGIKSKHDCVSNEKCPRCLTVFQHFLDLDDGLLACFKCGSVFVSKPFRDEIYEHILDILKSPVQVATEFKAVCGKICKNAAGVSAHERHCDDCKR